MRTSETEWRYSMLQYLIILLDETSASYCHADNPCHTPQLMPIDLLRKAIRFGMMENLMIEYVLPDYDLPDDYLALLDSIDNIKIGKDVRIFNSIPSVCDSEHVVLRLKCLDAIKQVNEISSIIRKVSRVSVIYTDIEEFQDRYIPQYKDSLRQWSSVLLEEITRGRSPQLNIITDRLELSEMHNCGAGETNITIAPNGKFYLCQSFYYLEKEKINDRLNHSKNTCSYSVGDMDSGIQIPNARLLALDHAPLCRICDAYHCQRCIFLNRKLTWDINTPSHQQCVMSHLERNASMDLVKKLRRAGITTYPSIKKINYLDPFDVRETW